MYKTINDVKINYFVKGEGDEVLFILHGWGANCDMFNNLADVCAKKYKVVALDFPGFGLSDEPPTAWNLDDYAEFTETFINGFEPKTIHLLGHSFGGRVIIKLLAQRKMNAKKVILTDSAGVLPKRTFKYKFKVRMFKIAKAILSLGLIKSIFPNALEYFRKRSGSRDYNEASPLMRQVLVKVVNEDLAPILKNIEQETLLVWGRNDTATPVSDAKIMEKEIKNAGLVVIENAAHYAFLDQPFIFTKVLCSFMNIS